MDLKAYYQNIRAQEAAIPDAFPVVVSLKTTDGGKEGITAEVTRGVAAKMILAGAARLATPDEAKVFHTAATEAKLEAEQRAAASKVEFSVLTAAELARLRGKFDASKDQA